MKLNFVITLLTKSFSPVFWYLSCVWNLMTLVLIGMRSLLKSSLWQNTNIPYHSFSCPPRSLVPPSCTSGTRHPEKHRHRNHNGIHFRNFNCIFPISITETPSYVIFRFPSPPPTKSRILSNEQYHSLSNPTIRPLHT